MTGVRVAHRAVAHVDHHDQRAEERLVAERPELLRGRSERVAGLGTEGERRAEQLLAPEREDPGDRAVTGDVDDQHRDRVLVEPGDVGAVARDQSLGGADVGRDRPSRRELADVGPQVRRQRQDDGRVLLDRLAGPIGVERQPRQADAHLVGVAGEPGELGRPDAGHRVVERAGSDPSQRAADLPDRHRDPSPHEQRGHDARADDRDQERRDQREVDPRSGRGRSRRRPAEARCRPRAAGRRSRSRSTSNPALPAASAVVVDRPPARRDAMVASALAVPDGRRRDDGGELSAEVARPRPAELATRRAASARPRTYGSRNVGSAVMR